MISPSLRRLLELFKQLRATTKQFNLTGFSDGVNRINKVTDAAKGLARTIGSIEPVASHAGAAMGRMLERV